MDLLYAIRKFEIYVITFESKTCQLCNIIAITQGVICDKMEKSNLLKNQENSYTKK